LNLESKEHELGRDEHQIKKELQARNQQKQAELDLNEELV
jgi:hypothetical protein